MIDVVPRPLRAHTGPDGCHDFFIGRSAPQQIADVGLFEAEQAVPEFAVGRDAKAIALRAERLADLWNEPDPSDAVLEYEIGCRRVRVLITDRRQGHDLP
jgi:hypothetical protein